jgi:tetratricopeptide (TPR) repeat protein
MRTCGFNSVSVMGSHVAWRLLLTMTSGTVTELIGDLDRALAAYEAALRHNPYSTRAMNSISCILRTKEQYPKAIDYLNSILQIEQNNGETWGSLGNFTWCTAPHASLTDY